MSSAVIQSITTLTPRSCFLETLLLGMSYDNAEVRPLLDLEGLKAWKPARTSGYRLLENAVETTQFYDANGNIRVTDYRY